MTQAWTETSDSDHTIRQYTAAVTNVDGNTAAVSCRGAYAAKCTISTVTTDDATCVFDWRSSTMAGTTASTITAAVGVVVDPVRAAGVAGTVVGYIDFTKLPSERIALRAATGTFSYVLTLEVFYRTGGRP